MKTKGKIAKYIHLLNANELKFQKPLVNLINNPENGFDSSDHVFVTPHKAVYNALNNFNNVLYDDSGDHLINKYAPQCDFLISQGVADVSTMLRTKRHYFKKIVFRTWGGSHQPVRREDFPFYKYLIERSKDFAYWLYMQITLGKSAAIGIANMVDYMDLRKWIKHTPLMPINFGGSNSYQIIEKLKNNPYTGNCLNFLVGHQGDPFENHYYYSKLLLERFGSYNIKIYVPLSYGNRTYINNTVEKLKKLNSDKIIILTELMEYEDYLKLLNTIHIGIFDTKTSMALGNISLLLSLSKKIVLNKNGVLKETFDYFGIPHICSEDLSRITYEQLLEPIIYDDNISDFRVCPLDKTIQQWNALFELLNNGGK